MKIFFLATALLAMTSSPAYASNKKFEGMDGYEFSDPKDPRSTITVTVKVYPDYKSVREAVMALGVKAVPKVWAFSVVKGNTCTIHMIDPNKDYRPELIGHEYLHCVYGQWHGTNVTDANENLGRHRQ